MDRENNDYFIIYNIRRAAFTLAEVLITLGVIGVVAAMTIPTLIANYQEKQTVSQLTKAFANISNAYQMAKIEYGELSGWGFANNSIISDSDVDQEIKDEVNSANANLFFDKLSKYLKVSERIDNSDKKYRRDILGGSKNVLPGSTILALTDGTCISGGHISNYQCKSKDICGDFSIDINGVSTPPNEIGRDVFYFYVYGSGIVPLGTVEDTNRSFEIYCDKDGTVGFNGYGCAAWVIYNKNMDYLHCSDLSWDGKHKCDE